MKRFILALSVMTAAVVPGLTLSSASAAMKMDRPVDPYASLGEGEKLTFTERERGLRYLNLVAQYDVYSKKPLEYSVGHLLDTARLYEPRYGDWVVSNPLALLNGSLYLLSVQYRNRLPVVENGKVFDSASNIESREFTLAAARVVIAAIAKLPDQKQQIDLEFRRQRSMSDPHLVLSSYLIPPVNADGVQPEPLFSGELEEALKTEMAKIEKSRTFTSRLLQKVRTSFGAKSCREAFL